MAPQGVAAAREPHHHPAFADPEFRVLRVEVPARDSTLLHRHDADYFWIALDESHVVNAVAGQPDAPISAGALSLHFTKGGFSHVARVPGDRAFRNITVELLAAQANPRNVCEAVLAAQPLACPDSARTRPDSAGSTVRRSFTTDQLRVSLLSIAAGDAVRGTGSRTPALLITLEETAAPALALQSGDSAGTWTKGVFRARPGMRWEVKNGGSGTVGVILVEPRVRARRGSESRVEGRGRVRG